MKDFLYLPALTKYVRSAETVYFTVTIPFNDVSFTLVCKPRGIAYGKLSGDPLEAKKRVKRALISLIGGSLRKRERSVYLKVDTPRMDEGRRSSVNTKVEADIYLTGEFTRSEFFETVEDCQAINVNRYIAWIMENNVSLDQIKVDLGYAKEEGDASGHSGQDQQS